MRKLYFLPVLAVALMAASCDEDSPANPSEIAPTFSMALLASNEVPLVTNVETSCTGNVTIRLNITRDAAQVITATNVDFTANISGCPSTTNIIAAHIHEGPAGVAAPVVIGTGIASGQVPLVNGAGSFTRNGVNVTDLSIIRRILDNPNAFYFNIHSTANGGGVIRAQLVRTQ
ncbi:MAG TPA: CHRD domain-containing protein [Vicinamibacterales bacterium]|nr:CHRD domain-containing protein [Vicinamibacterales bacterium]